MKQTYDKFHKHWYRNEAEWLELRRNLGIGGSEIAAILGHDPYTSSAKVFYQKLGLVPPDIENHAMFMGKEREADIADRWKYYDPKVGQDSLRMNKKAGRILRRNRSVRYLMQSRRYPWLFASVDRIFNQEPYGKSILEIKTIRGWEANKWETGIPTKYIFQIQHYLAVTGYKYAELFIETDGRDYDLVPIEPSTRIIAEIIDAGREFQKLVDEGRRRLADGATEDDIQDLVPAPDGSPAYSEFIKERYRESQPDTIIPATEDDLKLIRDYTVFKEMAEDAAQQFERVKQLLQGRMLRADKLDCGKYGRIDWKTNARGARPWNMRINFSDLLQDFGEIQ